MSDQDWEKLMAKVDKEIAAIPESGPPPKQPLMPSGQVGTAPAPPAMSAAPPITRGDSSWPAYVRLALSSLLGFGVLFWPYANRCGVGLGGYLFVVTVVALSGVWSAVWTWRHQTARAHILSILVIVWGLVLAGAEVLPRTGYAKQALTWSCKK